MMASCLQQRMKRRTWFLLGCLVWRGTGHAMPMRQDVAQCDWHVPRQSSKVKQAAHAREPDLPGTPLRNDMMACLVLAASLPHRDAGSWRDGRNVLCEKPRRISELGSGRFRSEAGLCRMTMGHGMNYLQGMDIYSPLSEQNLTGKSSLGFPQDSKHLPLSRFR